FALVNAPIGADTLYLDTQSPSVSRGSSLPQDAPIVVSEPAPTALADSSPSPDDSASDRVVAGGAPSLTVHMLGPFRAALNDRPALRHSRPDRCGSGRVRSGDWPVPGRFHGR